MGRSPELSNGQFRFIKVRNDEPPTDGTVVTGLGDDSWASSSKKFKIAPTHISYYGPGYGKFLPIQFYCFPLGPNCGKNLDDDYGEKSPELSDGQFCSIWDRNDETSTDDGIVVAGLGNDGEHGIPNLEDQNVHGHETAFQERTLSASSTESLLSQRSDIDGSAGIDESEQSSPTSSGLSSNPSS